MTDLIACFKDDECFHNLTAAQREEANHAFALKQDHDLNIFFQVSLGILVFFMQAGFALLEAGSVRVKNTTNILLKVSICLSVCLSLCLSISLSVSLSFYLCCLFLFFSLSLISYLILISPSISPFPIRDFVSNKH